MRCATHPNIETNLRCGKCDKPICPRCLVMTPVGARCRDCAGMRRLPTYQVAAGHYLKAMAAGAGSALAAGFLWYLSLNLIPFAGFLNIIIAAGAGYLIGSIVSRTVNRKHGRGLAAIGALSFVLSYLMQLFLLGYAPREMLLLFNDFSAVYRILALAAGIFLAINQLR